MLLRAQNLNTGKTFAENSNISEPGHLQNDLDCFQKWSDENLLRHNPSKCRALQVSFSKVPPLKLILKSVLNLLHTLTRLKFLALYFKANLNGMPKLTTCYAKRIDVCLWLEH